MTFDILVACDTKGGIGRNGEIPWYLPPDLKWFQQKTTETVNPHKRNAVIMGHNTWKSLPKKPLKNRRNIVLTSSNQVEDIIDVGAKVCRSLDDALEYLKNDPVTEKIFVIGGGKLYETAIHHLECKNIYLTRIEKEYDCDTFFPIDILKRVSDDDKLHDYSEFVGINYVGGLKYQDIPYSYSTYVNRRYV